MLRSAGFIVFSSQMAQGQRPLNKTESSCPGVELDPKDTGKTDVQSIGMMLSVIRMRHVPGVTNKQRVAANPFID